LPTSNQTESNLGFFSFNFCVGVFASQIHQNITM